MGFRALLYWLKWSLWAVRASVSHPTCSASASIPFSASLLQTLDHKRSALDRQAAFPEDLAERSGALSGLSVTRRREVQTALAETNLELSYVDHLLQGLQPESAQLALGRPVSRRARAESTDSTAQSVAQESLEAHQLSALHEHDGYFNASVAVTGEPLVQSTLTEALLRATNPRHHPLLMRLESTLESISASLLQGRTATAWRQEMFSPELVQKKTFIQGLQAAMRKKKVQGAGLGISILLLATLVHMLYKRQSGICKAAMASEPDGQEEQTDEVWRFNATKDPFIVCSMESGQFASERSRSWAARS